MNQQPELLPPESAVEVITISSSRIAETVLRVRDLGGVVLGWTRKGESCDIRIMLDAALVEQATG